MELTVGQVERVSRLLEDTRARITDRVMESARTPREAMLKGETLSVWDVLYDLQLHGKLTLLVAFCRGFEGDIPNEEAVYIRDMPYTEAVSCVLDFFTAEMLLRLAIPGFLYEEARIHMEIAKRLEAVISGT